MRGFLFLFVVAPMYFCCTNFVFGDSEIYEIQSYRKDYPTEVIITTIKKYFQSKGRNPK